MKLLHLIGNASVGKMTVGQELMKITEMRLFHNHITIEPVLEVFGYYNKSAIWRLREVFFDEFSLTDFYGMIFTYMMPFDQPSCWNYINEICDIFKKNNADSEFYFAELIAPREVRLKRNSTENRLKNKPSKNKDIEYSNIKLIIDDESARFESYEGEVVAGLGIKPEQYIRIENTDVPPEKAAAMIKERFNL